MSMIGIVRGNMAGKTFYGLLWAEYGKDPIEKKAQRAVEAHKKKMGNMPSICYISEAEFGKDHLKEVGGVTLESLPSIRVGTFMIGHGR